MSKVRFVLALLLGALLSSAMPVQGATVKSAPPATKPAPDPYQQRIVDMVDLYRAGKIKAASREHDAILADRRFEGLGDAQRASLLLVGGAMKVDEKAWEGARELLLRSTRIQPEAPAWYLLALVELTEGDGDLAASYLARGVRMDAKLLDDFQEFLVANVLRKAGHASEARLELMQALYDADWDRFGLGGSGIWFELGELRVQRNELALALGPLRQVDTALPIVQLRVDRRFDAARAELGPLPSPEQLAQQRIKHLRGLVAEQPRRLDVVSELMESLLAVGEWNDIIRLSDEVRSRRAAATADAPAYEDEGALPWVMNLRSIALLAAGRVDEALAELITAAATPEYGQQNVSQILNLGVLYTRLGRADEALAAIAPVGEMSGYGKMVQTSVKLRAALLKQDKRGAAQAMDYLLTHRADAQSIYLEGLIVTGQMDEAAAELGRQLDSLETRSRALLSVQKFRLEDPLPGDLPLRASWEVLMARDDVQAAIYKVGRVETFGIYLQDGGY